MMKILDSIYLMTISRSPGAGRGLEGHLQKGDENLATSGAMIRVQESE